MEWEPNERDAWVSDAQRWIGQIKGVLQCKIDLDPMGEIEGVHVVAGMARDPRHVVRDVESLLKARLDLDVYYKKIGVVQVVGNDLERADGIGVPAAGHVAGRAGSGSGVAVPGSTVTFHPPRTDHDESLPGEPKTAAVDSQGSTGAAAPIPAILVAEDLDARVVCGSVGVMASETTLRAEVQLCVGEIEARGLREGPNHADSDLLLVARATVAAVAELITDPVLLHLKDLRLPDVGGETVVLCAVDLVEGRQSTTLFGTCRTSHNRQQAVVYAVLDALNRRLGLHGLKTLSGAG